MHVLQRLLAIPGLPPPVARSFRCEQLTECTLPVALSLIEGGFAAVVAAKTFDVEPWLLAVISASPMFGNLSSFVWNRIASARSKVPMVVTLQGAGARVRVRRGAEPAVERRRDGARMQRHHRSAADRRRHHRAQRHLESELRPPPARARDEPAAGVVELDHRADDEHRGADSRCASGELSLAVRGGRADRNDRRLVVLARDGAGRTAPSRAGATEATAIRTVATASFRSCAPIASTRVISCISSRPASRR